MRDRDRGCYWLSRTWLSFIIRRLQCSLVRVCNAHEPYEEGLGYIVINASLTFSREFLERAASDLGGTPLRSGAMLSFVIIDFQGVDSWTTQLLSRRIRCMA